MAYHDAVLEELGDSLWYFANAALRANLSLSTIAQRMPATLENWDYQGRLGPTSFIDLRQTGREFAGPLVDALKSIYSSSSEAFPGAFGFLNQR